MNCIDCLARRGKAIGNFFLQVTFNSLFYGECKVDSEEINGAPNECNAPGFECKNINLNGPALINVVSFLNIALNKFGGRGLSASLNIWLPYLQFDCSYIFVLLIFLYFVFFTRVIQSFPWFYLIWFVLCFFI